MPTVPAPAGAMSETTQVPSTAPTILVQTGLGTNGVEAGRQIVEVLQAYTRVDRDAIAALVRR